MLRLINRNSACSRQIYKNRTKIVSCVTQSDLFQTRIPGALSSAIVQAQSHRYASTGVEQPFITSLWQTLSQSTPVAYMQQALIDIHDYTGLPWWASIVFSTVLFRSIITLPLTIYQHKITARLEKITTEMPAIVTELKKEAAMAMKKFNWTEKHTKMIYNRSLKKQWNKLIVRDNCHPAKTLIVLWGQIPLWVCQSVALRNIVHMLPDPTALQAKIIYTELTIGGFGWIPNLIEIDSSYILPVTLGLINLGIIEVQAIVRNRPTSRLQKYATNAFRILSVAMVPIACTVPSALCVYWVASSSYGLAQNLLLLSPEVRRSFGIPATKNELPNPYEHLWKTITMRRSELRIATDLKSDKPQLNDELKGESKESQLENNKSKEPTINSTGNPSRHKW